MTLANGRARCQNSKSVREIWAWVSVDETGEEGLVALVTAFGVLPAIGADRERVQSSPILDGVRATVTQRGRPAVLKRFQLVEEIETMWP
jgi:hypothetical protein